MDTGTAFFLFGIISSKQNTATSMNCFPVKDSGTLPNSTTGLDTLLFNGQKKKGVYFFQNLFIITTTLCLQRAKLTSCKCSFVRRLFVLLLPFLLQVAYVSFFIINYVLCKTLHRYIFIEVENHQLSFIINKKFVILSRCKDIGCN